MRDKQTGELVAVKFIERGEKVGRATCLAHLHLKCNDLTLARYAFEPQGWAALNQHHYRLLCTYLPGYSDHRCNAVRAELLEATLAFGFH